MRRFYFSDILALNLNNIDYSKAHAFFIGSLGENSPKEITTLQS